MGKCEFIKLMKSKGKSAGTYYSERGEKDKESKHFKSA
jgi:hypothetical protein